MDSKGLETLADYVRRVRIEKRLSLTDVKRQSHGLISDAYVSRIENGHSDNPSPRLLRALARGLQVPEDELFAIARGTSPSEPSVTEAQLLAVFRQLPESYQGDLLKIARSLYGSGSLKPRKKAVDPPANWEEEWANRMADLVATRLIEKIENMEEEQRSRKSRVRRKDAA